MLFSVNPSLRTASTAKVPEACPKVLKKLVNLKKVACFSFKVWVLIVYVAVALLSLWVTARVNMFCYFKVLFIHKGPFILKAAQGAESPALPAVTSIGNI